MKEKRNKLTLVDSGFVFALAIFTPAVVSLVLAFVMYGNKDFLAGAERYWVLAFISQFILLACSVGYSLKQKIALPAAVGMKNKVKAWHIALIVPLGFALLCFNLPVQTAITNFLQNCGLEMSAASSMPPIENIGMLFLAIALVAVLPSFGEEIIYRGFICNTMAAPGSKIDVKAVFLSAALFAVMHQSPLQTVHPFILGVVMAVVYLATRSIWASITLHFTNNLLVIVLGYACGGAFEAFVVSNWWWIMPAALVVALPILYLFVKNAKSVDWEPTQEVIDARLKERNKSLPYFVAATFFCLVMWVFVLIG